MFLQTLLLRRLRDGCVLLIRNNLRGHWQVAIEPGIQSWAPVLGGVVFYPMNVAKEAFRFMDEFSRMCPAEISTFLAGAPAPDGTPCVGIAMCYCGPLEKGVELVKLLRKFGPPLVDMLAVRSDLEMQSFFDEAFTPGRYYYWKSSLLRRISEDACGRAYRMHAEDADEPGKLLLYAAVAWRRSRVKPADSAFPHRTIITTAGQWGGNGEKYSRVARILGGDAAVLRTQHLRE